MCGNVVREGVLHHHGDVAMVTWKYTVCTEVLMTRCTYTPTMTVLRYVHATHVKYMLIIQAQTVQT